MLRTAWKLAHLPHLNPSLQWTGLLVGGVGTTTHQLWLLYLGYDVLGGCGLGLGYVSPVSIFLRWFPDRRGMADRMAIRGLGSDFATMPAYPTDYIRTQAWRHCCSPRHMFVAGRSYLSNGKK